MSTIVFRWECGHERKFSMPDGGGCSIKGMKFGGQRPTCAYIQGEVSDDIKYRVIYHVLHPLKRRIYQDGKRLN